MDVDLVGLDTDRWTISLAQPWTFLITTDLLVVTELCLTLVTLTSHAGSASWLGLRPASSPHAFLRIWISVEPGCLRWLCPAHLARAPGSWVMAGEIPALLAVGPPQLPAHHPSGTKCYF